MGLRWWRRRSGRGSEPPGPTEARAALAALELRVRDQVPGQVSDRIERLRALIDETLPGVPGLAASSAEYFSLIATATRYMPDAVDAYLALPRSFANHHVVEGKTALALLCDQLDLLESTLTDIVDNLRRSNRDRLAANGRFLEEKFGPTEVDLGNGVPPR